MRKLLLVIDMQNDFIDGALGTKEAAAIVEKVRAKIRTYPPRDIIATLDTHGADYLKTQEGRLLPVEHCIRETSGWKIHRDLAVLLTEAKLYEKPAFGSFRLAEDLRTLAETQEIELELVGLCTDICVISNALLIKAFLPETPVIVDAACCAGVTPESHRRALEAMKACQIEIVNE